MNNNIVNLDTVNRIANFIESNSNYSVVVGRHGGARKAVGLCIKDKETPIGFLHLTANDDNCIVYDTGRMTDENSFETAILPTNITLICEAAMTFLKRLYSKTPETAAIAA